MTLNWLHQDPERENESYHLDLLRAVEASFRGEIRSQGLHVLYRQTVGDIQEPHALKSEAHYLLQLSLDGLQQQVFGQDVLKVFKKNRRSLAVNMVWTKTVGVETVPGKLERVDVTGVEDGGQIEVAGIPLRVWRNDNEVQRRRRLLGWFRRAVKGRRKQLGNILQANQEAEPDVLQPVMSKIEYLLDKERLLECLPKTDWEYLLESPEKDEAGRRRRSRTMARAEFVAALINRVDAAGIAKAAMLRAMPEEKKKTWITRQILMGSTYRSEDGSPDKVKGAQNTG